MNSFYTWITYLSGHIPIAFIYFISVLWAEYKNDLVCPYIFISLSIIYLVVSIIAAVVLYNKYDTQLKNLQIGNGGNKSIIRPTKIKSLFTSDAMSYYVLPFAAFASSDDLVKTTLILLVLTLIFGISFVRERMNLYTPCLILFGFVLFSCKVNNIDDADDIEIDILTKNPKKLVFGCQYQAVLQRINDTTATALIYYDI
ncbi:hypothetical protein [uncultured Megasphaera sp.]|uniref:hypothetical protein n=1 Tax=uncultured Megasphaera sp. TaxID=165188 RepID=UPI002598B59D|nr:hypothetical protein [uncultured Megasphaera sp.]